MLSQALHFGTHAAAATMQTLVGMGQTQANAMATLMRFPFRAMEVAMGIVVDAASAGRQAEEVVISPPRPVMVCPEPELLAAYADSALELDERHETEEHLVLCARCRALVALVAGSSPGGDSDAAYVA